MRSWLAQSLRTLEDMVDSGELTEEELRAMSRAALVPNNVPSSMLPAALPIEANAEADGDVDEEEIEREADATGVHATQQSSSPEQAPAPKEKTGTRR